MVKNREATEVEVTEATDVRRWAKGASADAIRRARRVARERFVDVIPSSYSPWLHLASTAGVGIVALAVGIARVRNPTARELLVIPLVFLLSNASEWRAHKDLLHRRTFPLHELYDRHTPEHHMVFGYDDMAVRSWRELKLVLIPAVGVVALVAGMAPLAYVLGRVWSSNAGWLALVTSALYMVGYELSHLSYHLPPESFIGRFPLVRVLREHHRRHHHPRLMQRWNFNVTIPIFDWIHRTSVPRDVLAQTLTEDARSGDPSSHADERGTVIGDSH